MLGNHGHLLEQELELYLSQFLEALNLTTLVSPGRANFKSADSYLQFSIKPLVECIMPTKITVH